MLMMVFDIMESHHKMTAWHDTSLDQQMAALAKLREAKRACHARIRTKNHSLKRRGSINAVMGFAEQDDKTPTQGLISSIVDMGARVDEELATNPIPGIVRRQSRGSQAFQLARSLGSAGELATSELPTQRQDGHKYHLQCSTMLQAIQNDGTQA